MFPQVAALTTLSSASRASSTTPSFPLWTWRRENWWVGSQASWPRPTPCFSTNHCSSRPCWISTSSSNLRRTRWGQLRNSQLPALRQSLSQTTVTGLSIDTLLWPLTATSDTILPHLSEPRLPHSPWASQPSWNLPGVRALSAQHSRQQYLS